MQEISDQALIERVVKIDDRHAFATLVRRYQSDVRNTLRRLCKGDFAQADDLAQEVFLKAYRFLPSFKGKSQFQTWLYRIAWTSFISFQKRNKARALSEISDNYQSERPLATIDHIHLQRDIEKALKQLSEVQQQMVELHFNRGFSHSEIVDITGIPLGTIKSHIQRAKIKLQTLLRDSQPTAPERNCHENHN